MAYYTKVLLPEEKVLYVGTIHWLIYLKGWFVTAIALLILIALFGTHVPGEPFVPSADHASGSALTMALTAAFLIFIVIGLIQLLSAWVRRATTEIVVTDKRIIFKEGFVRRRTMEMNMNKVETVDVQQSILGRMLNCGTVLIRGTGSSYEPLRLVEDPLALRTAIVAQ